MRCLPYIALSVLVLAGAAAPVRAAVVECVPGGSSAAPNDYQDPTTWSPPVVPDATTDVLLSEACTVRCGTGECDAHTLKGTNPLAALEVGPGAALVLSGCEDSDASDPTTYECGGENGFVFAPQGAIVHDSTQDGDPILRGAAVDGQPNHLRLLLSAPIGVQVGDWFQVRGGPERDQVHRVTGVDVSGCPDPASCFFEVALHDPGMSFGDSANTQGFATTIGTMTSPATVRVPAATSGDASQCVEICTQRSGPDCVAASAISRDFSYVGWMFGAADTVANPADPAGLGHRLLVVETRNDVPESIGPGQGVVDRVCFADPLPDAWRPQQGGYRDLSGVFWPGYWPGDPWVLFRPATVRYVGAQGDGGLGFHHACVESEFAYFDGWAKLSNQYGTPECQAPYQDTVVVSAAHGLAGVPFDQQAGCNGHSLDVWFYPALQGDRVALVDTRTPTDTSATCDWALQPGDGDPTSSYHGVSLVNTAFDPDVPPSDWLIRYAGDDGAILDTSGLGPETWTMRRWTWWYDMAGDSTETVDFLASVPGQVVRIEDGRVVLFASAAGCGTSFDDPNGNVRFEADGLLYVDPRPQGIAGSGMSVANDLRNVLAWGDADAACPALTAGSLHSSWIQGWNRLIWTYVSGLDGVYYGSRGGTVLGTVLGGGAVGASVELRDFVFTGLPNEMLLEPVCGSGCNVNLHDGFASWAQPNSFGVSNLYPGTTMQLGAPLQGLLFSRSALIGCSSGGGENGTHIGTNVLVAPPGGYPIANSATCPLAAPQDLPSGTGFAPEVPFRADLFGGHFGPENRVGLDASATIASDAGLESLFAIPETVCANGIDDDWDGLVDLDDPGCSDASDSSERRPDIACDDGIDNDGDGLVDAGFDPGCANAYTPLENPQCDDGIDDDGDGRIDWADPQCSRSFPFNEGAKSCGLGFELALLAPLLRRLARLGTRHRG